jgi:hypothetical protein
MPKAAFVTDSPLPFFPIFRPSRNRNAQVGVKDLDTAGIDLGDHRRDEENRNDEQGSYCENYLPTHDAPILACFRSPDLDNMCLSQSGNMLACSAHLQ